MWTPLGVANGKIQDLLRCWRSLIQNLRMSDSQRRIWDSQTRINTQNMALWRPQQTHDYLQYHLPPLLKLIMELDQACIWATSLPTPSLKPALTLTNNTHTLDLTQGRVGTWPTTEQGPWDFTITISAQVFEAGKSNFNSLVMGRVRNANLHKENTFMHLQASQKGSEE